MQLLYGAYTGCYFLPGTLCSGLLTEFTSCPVEKENLYIIEFTRLFFSVEVRVFGFYAVVHNDLD